MSEKKTLNNEELEKVNGGVNVGNVSYFEETYNLKLGKLIKYWDASKHVGEDVAIFNVFMYVLNCCGKIEKVYDYDYCGKIKKCVDIRVNTNYPTNTYATTDLGGGLMRCFVDDISNNVIYEVKQYL